MATPPSELPFEPLLVGFDEYVAHPVRKVIYKASGIKSPLGRLAIYYSLYTSALYATKPERCFGPDGRAYPWAVLQGEDSPNAVYVPAWLEGFTVAFLLSLFI